MFGYVKPFVPNLRVKEHEFYKSIYCGLCRSMKKHTGGVSTFTLSYDMVFFALVRLALTGNDCKIRRRSCAAHPFRKRPIADDCPELEYSARTSALLVYYKCKDDVRDERGAKRLFYKAALPYAKRMNKRAKLPEAEAHVSDCIARLCALEEEKCSSPDMAADTFGELLGGLSSFGLEGDSAAIARQIGFHTGRWVYLADAACDYAEDRADGKYNPFIYAFESAEEAGKFFSDDLWEILTLELCEIEKAVALIDKDRSRTVLECINNIIHGGMESAFSLAAERRRRNEKRSV